MLPETGLERFCALTGGATRNVYVLAEFDSYHGNTEQGDDDVMGQIEETLETNNVAASTTSWQISNVDCSGVEDITTNPRRKGFF